MEFSSHTTPINALSHTNTLITCVMQSENAVTKCLQLAPPQKIVTTTRHVSEELFVKITTFIFTCV